MNSMIASKVFEIGVAGLTAVMTLITGMPRIDCICPNGDVKHFCMGSATGSSCCCEGSCCGNSTAPASPSPRPVKKSCCRDSAANDEKSASQTKGQRAGQNPCRMQLADSTVASVASVSGNTSSCETSGVLHLSPPSFSQAIVAPIGTWHHLGSPPTPLPPTDLLATCKRLLI